MSNSLAKTVNLAISRQTQAVPLPGFGIPLILGVNAAGGAVKSYSSLASVANDFTSSTPEYKAAQALFAQALVPPVIKIAQRRANVAQVETVTPTTLTALAVYTVTIAGVAYAFTADASPLATEIVAGLIALINADSACPMTASGTSTLVLTAKNAGQTSVVAVDSKMSIAHTTPSVGPAEDMAVANELDANWYCLLLPAHDDQDALSVAPAIEAMARIFLHATNTSGVKVAATTTDVASVMKGKSYKRSAVLWSGNLTAYPDAGWAGRVLPITPGGENWAYKTIAGVTPDSLTDSEMDALDGKWANYYVTRGGFPLTIGGRVAGQDYLDITRGIDWLTSLIQANVFGQIIALDKIPYNDEGIAIVEAQLMAALEAAKKAKFLSSYQILPTTYAEQTSQDKADRRLVGPNFTAVAAGAVNKVQINGTVTL